MSRAAIFVGVTCILAYVSRHSLRAPASHGFFRFFAWEAILALSLLNAPRWFDDPFSLPQVLSWLLLLGSLVLVVPGALAFVRSGNISRHRADATLFPFERTTSLVTSGAYRYIRHPMYGALLFLAWGVFCKDPSLAGSVLVVVASIFLFKTATADERECVRYFGEPYRAYMRTTRRFVPYLF
jgi:protein-S-isoprenylcysteine O-methyltransferase Ste14